MRARKPVLAYDIAQAERFLSALATTDPDVERWCFQTFDDNDDSDDRRLVAQLTGELAELRSWLGQMSERGAGVFVTVNRTDGRGRKAENVERVRALFVDIDREEPPAQAPLPPSMVVRSGRGWHWYWLAADVPLERFTELQARAIAAVEGADVKPKDLPRVMRLPGYPHRKDPSNPRAVELRKVHTERVYSLDDFEKALPSLPPPPEPPPAAPRPTSGSDDYLHRLRRAEAYIDRMPGSINGGGGSDACWSAALACVKGFALAESDAVAILERVHNPKCSAARSGQRAQWSRAELEHKVRDAARAANVPDGYLLDEDEPPRAGSMPARLSVPRHAAQWDGYLSHLEDTGSTEPAPTGLDGLDRLLPGGLPSGGYTLLAAPTGHGKTSLALGVALTTARAPHSRPAIVASYELTKHEAMDRLCTLQLDGRASWRELGEKQPQAVGLARRDAIPELRQLPLYVFEAEEVRTLTMLEAAVCQVAERHEAKPLLVVDYAQDLMRLVRDAGEARQQAGEVAYWFRELAKRHQVPVLLLSSVGRANAAIAGRDGRPDLDRARGAAKESGDFEYHAAAVLYLQRAGGEDGGERHMWLAVPKCRKGREGHVATVYRGLSGWFDECSENDMPRGADGGAPAKRPEDFITAVLELAAKTAARGDPPLSGRSFTEGVIGRAGLVRDAVKLAVAEGLLEVCRPEGSKRRGHMLTAKGRAVVEQREKGASNAG